MGAIGRRKQLSDIRRDNRVDIICLQETIKGDFSLWDLESLSEGEPFEWVWTAAQGHSGGTLIGVRISDINILSKDKGEFYTSMKLVSNMDKVIWEIVNVYGPVQTDRKQLFLDELTQKITDMTDSFIIGGDFNLIRFTWEKSSENTDQLWMDKFNDFIRDNGVRELIRKGGRFTWTNKHNNPIMSVLDRVLICPSWDQLYRRASCESLTRVGSDHCPLVVNTDDQRFRQQHQFRFEMSWLTQAGF
jgi:exonuclease III